MDKYNKGNMVYITGDTHGDFRRIADFCRFKDTKKSDIMIILGDAGINYFGDEKDERKKQYIQSLPVTLFCIHGNHEMRPQTINGYKEYMFHGGVVWHEDAFPNILFARDGEVYDFCGKKCLVIGGAYSVDKYYRIFNGLNWFEDEQPDQAIKLSVEKKLNEINFETNIVLTHTCPKKYEPMEAFLPGLNQSTIDKSTEIWLDKIEESIKYDRWYCGHWHISKKIDNVVFMFDGFETI